MASLRQYEEQLGLGEYRPPESPAPTPTSRQTGIYTNGRINPYYLQARGGFTGREIRLGGPGTGGGGRVQPSTVTTTRKPTMKAPTAPSIPTFQAPEFDESEVRKRTQKLAAPSLRKLRSALQREQARYYENPNVRSMTLREALEGYGLGVEGALAGAESRARAEYGQEYAREYEAAAMNFKAQTEAAMQSYNNAFAAYLQSMQQVTETAQGTPVPTGGPQPGMVHGGYSASGKELFKWSSPEAMLQNALATARSMTGGA